MKTSELIDVLSTGAGPAPRAVVARRLLPCAAIAWIAAAGAALILMGPAPADVTPRLATGMKVACALALAWPAGWLTARLARPASPTRGPRRLLLAVFALIALLGTASVYATPSDHRLAHLLGHSALQCPWNVLALSMPGLAAILWAVRGLAPTRPRAAGLAAGLFAGALAAAAYALACRETSTTFFAVWYTLGIVLCGGVGAWLGPRTLRW